MKHLLLFCATVLFLFTGIIHSAQTKTPDARMLRFADVSKTQIVFIYSGDIWTVAKSGGIARRLTVQDGREIFPKFSPDGTTIAFSANYNGNTDVYTMPSLGGQPERLTHHPYLQWVVDWYPDGKDILFRSDMNSPTRGYCKFFKTSASGGMPEQLPLKYAEQASFSPDGKKIAFQYQSRLMHTWKRYRGGLASEIWIYDLARNISEQVTDFDGTDALPMWHKNTIYFLSDRGKNSRLNIWAYEINDKKFRQVTEFSDYDVKWPSLGNEDIVFENAGKLYLLQLSNEKVKQVNIQIPSDLPKIQRKLKDAFKNIANFDLSPSGKRAVFEARGEIFTVPEKHGSVRNLTNTSGSAERFSVWSPDGRSIAYFSDKTGEYELYIKPSDGKTEEKQVTSNGKCFRYGPVWSQDCNSIAFNDKTGRLYIADIASGKCRLIDRNYWERFENYSFSPDSRWLTYSRHQDNQNQAVMIFDTNEGNIHQVTSGYYNDCEPVFSKDGKYLFFRSNRALNIFYSDLDWNWLHLNSARICSVSLKSDIDSLIGPKSDEEPIDNETDDTETDGSKDPNEKINIQIDFTDIEKRVVELDIESGDFDTLACIDGKLLFMDRSGINNSWPREPAGILKWYDIKERETKTVIGNISDYKVSADGSKVLYHSEDTYGIIDIEENKNVGDGKIATEKMRAWIEPQQEWRQIFNEAWRIERDYFYDPGMHGVNWPKVKKRYEVLLDHVVDRIDLNYVIGEMIGEMNSSHTYVGGGDIDMLETIHVGLAGCSFRLDRKNDLYQIGEIYQAGPWDTETRSSLKRPGIDVKEGQYLIAVNGKPLDTSKDPWAAFENLAGEIVTLTVNDKPTSKSATDILVKLMADDRRLRNLQWIEENRKKVDIATKGRVGYVYVPNTGSNGNNELIRQFMAQKNKDGLIIDERFNFGGWVPDRLIEILNRPTYSYWARRDFNSEKSPYISLPGPKVMLINSWSVSGGDAFPYFFKKAELGPLVGTRTRGGLIGMSGNPRFIDGGRVTAPNFSFWNTDGNWDIESTGVAPDYEVEEVPHETAFDRDPQLDKAIEVILEQLRTNPPRKLPTPAYPKR